LIPGTVHVESVAELQKDENFNSMPGQIHGAIFRAVLGKLPNQAPGTLCRGFGRRKG